MLKNIHFKKIGAVISIMCMSVYLSACATGLKLSDIEKKANEGVDDGAKVTAHVVGNAGVYLCAGLIVYGGIQCFNDTQNLKKHLVQLAGGIVGVALSLMLKGL